MRRLCILLLTIGLFPMNGMARPVGFADSWMLMQTNDYRENSLAVSYSPTARDAFGVRSDVMREMDAEMHTATYNRLIERWNSPESQANLFFMSGAGVAHSETDGTAPAAFAGFEADWENRRLLVQYENRFIASDALREDFSQRARVGVAPYVAGYDDVHSWLILQVDHSPTQSDEVVVTPLVRLFNTRALGEIGFSSQKNILFNLTLQF